jgi:5-dehydro-2-deoxygluconokinase
VSRHGCAPALPSAEELADFLARSDRPEQLHADPHTAHLHRVTTGRRPRPCVLALAFDHRKQLETLAAQHRQKATRIAAFKRLIQAGLHAAGNPDTAGAIVDDRYGRDCLFTLAGTDLWLARAIELPGVVPLAFEGGDDVTATLRAWPAGQVAKCLVQYHPDDDAPLRAAQDAQLLRLQRACHATGHEWLLEIVPPADRAIGDGEWIARSVAHFYAIGLVPDWWKLPPVRDTAFWRKVGEHITHADPHCRGILVLGLDSEETALAEAFAAARTEPRVTGFAVGRHIFWQVADDWFAGRCDDQTAIGRIAERYRAVVAAWHAAAPKQTLQPTRAAL